jgi:hypothetical protein
MNKAPLGIFVIEGSITRRDVSDAPSVRCRSARLELVQGHQDRKD